MYKGVNQTNRGTFVATFYMNGESVHIGEYDSDIQAAVAYDITVDAVLGEFATDRNFPELTEFELDKLAEV